MLLKRKFSFEAGHRLAKGYVGKCSNLHGHSWNCELVVEFNALDLFGMGVDFSIMKQACKFIEDKLDHKMLLFSGDKLVVDFCYDNSFETYLFEDNPTSEVIALFIKEEAKKFLEEHYMPVIEIKSVVVMETANSICEA